jgi:hypothetical protein
MVAVLREPHSSGYGNRPETIGRSGPASYQYPAGGCQTQNSLPSRSARTCHHQPVSVTEGG